MRKKTMRLIFWGAIAVLSSSLLVIAGVWVGEQTGGGRDKGERAGADSDSDFENRLFGKLAEELENIDDDDVEDEDIDTAREILREADTILSRVKRENREAMRRANQRPRIVRPEKKAPAPDEKQEKTPEPAAKKPENPNSGSPAEGDLPSKI